MEHISHSNEHEPGLPLGPEAAAPDANDPMDHGRAERELDPASAEPDLEDAIAWAHAVHRVFTELQGDPEFEAWLNREYAKLEKEPEFQERVARDRDAFLAMVREHSRHQEPGPIDR